MKVFAASLVASTLLTGSIATATNLAHAQGTIEAIDPTKGFAPLVEHVMPSVVSVEVKFQPPQLPTDPEDVPPTAARILRAVPAIP